MNCGLRCGATIVTLPKFDPEMFLGAIQKYKLSYLQLVPPIVLFLAKHPVVDKFDLSSARIIFSGAAPLDAQLQAACNARLPEVAVRQGYGMTEMSPVSTFNADFEGGTKVGSAGMLVPNCEAKLVDVCTMCVWV